MRNRHASGDGDSGPKKKPNVRVLRQVGTVSRNEFIFVADSGGKLWAYVIKGVAPTFTAPPIS
jgi:hypothetical protein